MNQPKPEADSVEQPDKDSLYQMNGHTFNDLGLCTKCGEDFMDVEGEDCNE